MTGAHAGAWLALIGLGAYHGINPGMGWLFAVALGMQEQRASAVLRAIVPLALGHAGAVAAALVLAALIGAVIPLRWLQWAVGLFLVGFGIYKLVRQRHPRYGGMRVRMGQLTLWSFLMASAHGAGLMVVPVLLAMEPHAHAHGGHAEHGAAPMQTGVLDALAATGVHTVAYLVVTAAVAWIVYAWVGVRFLRRAWVNLDLVWAAALIVTGAVTLLL